MGEPSLRQMPLSQALTLAADHMRAGEYAQAESMYNEILAQFPNQVESLYGLGWARAGAGRIGDAIELFQQAVSFRPGNAGYHHALGAALMTAARLDEAIEAFTKSLAINESQPEVYNHLGNTLLSKGALDQAIKALRRALELKPDYPDAVARLSCALINVGDLEQPITYCTQAITLWPDQMLFYRLLAWAYREAGRIDAAIETYRQALARKADPQIHSDLLFTLHFHPDCDRRRLVEEHATWNKIHARPIARQGRPFTNDPTPQRRIKVAYVAHDLGDNPLGHFFLPLAEHHDRRGFDVFCYCDLPRPDHLGMRLRELPGFNLRITGGISPRQVAEWVEREQVDILVDLSMHSSDNRILTFACKPAPIQVSYLAYCSTTGLEAIDYRFTDRYFDPPEWAQDSFVEKPVRLKSYWCYADHAVAPPVGPAPAMSNGFVTFGCLNEFSKVSPACLSLWCRLLRAAPTARLMLHAKQGAHRQRTAETLAREQIDAMRIQFIDREPLDKHLARYNQIDIGLDPFPWGGGSSTCDALWMGVPIVSLAGQTGVSRGGLSILSTIALPDLATNNPEDYIRTALALAGDLPRLSELRAGLRDRMRSSPLMDAPGFTRDVEDNYREMWRNWCEQR